MPDIGATLREARMRQRIDISEIESETKIRAKYLRALESEEWPPLDSGSATARSTTTHRGFKTGSEAREMSVPSPHQRKAR